QWLNFDPASGTFSGTPPLNYNGGIDVKVSVSDGAASVIQTFVLTITPVNDAPVANDDTATTTENTPVTRTAATGLLTNDTDVDGDVLTTQAGTFATSQGGSITVSTDGSYTYTPA